MEGLGGREGVRGCVRKIGLYCDASINSRPENLLGVTMLSFHPFLVETSLFFPLNKGEFSTSYDTEGLIVDRVANLFIGDDRKIYLSRI